MIPESSVYFATVQLIVSYIMPDNMFRVIRKIR